MSTGLFAWLQRRMGRGLTVLMYHRVLPDHQCIDYPHASLVMPISAFRQQVRWLADKCRVMTVGDGVDWLRAGRAADRPVVCISFDDGYHDNFDHAAPILEAAGLRASFYVTVDYIGARRLLWFDHAAAIWLHTPPARLKRRARAMLGDDADRACAGFDAWIAALKRLPNDQRGELIEACDLSPMPVEILDEHRMMTIDQVRRLHAAGHEIGSHTLKHPMLTQHDEAEAAHALVASRAAIREWIDDPVVGLAYPDGDFDRNVARLTREAGYGYALGTDDGINLPGCDSYALRRIDMNPSRVLDTALHHDSLAFRGELTRFHGGMRRWITRSRSALSAT